jgi:hypothetical protein
MLGLAERDLSHPNSRHTTIMTTNTDHRKAADDSLQSLINSVQSQPHTAARDGFLEECAALRLAIRAFHMEGIRFRMFNVDRLITRGELPISDDARHAFAEVRAQLEAAGFHTRSHQAPS